VGGGDKVFHRSGDDRACQAPGSCPFVRDNHALDLEHKIIFRRYRAVPEPEFRAGSSFRSKLNAMELI